MKIISFCVSEWVFNTYLSDLKNRSRYIEEMIIKGTEIDSGDFASTKQKMIKLIKENRNLNNEVARLKTQLGRYKSNELTDNEKMAKAIKARGLY